MQARMGSRQRESCEEESSGGFNRLELTIVTAIVGILILVAVAGAGNVLHDSEATSCRSDYQSVQSAQESYHAQTSTYATSLTELENTVTVGNGTEIGPWLKKAPGTNHDYVISLAPAPNTPDGSGAGEGDGDGEVMVATGHHPAAPGDKNCSYA